MLNWSISDGKGESMIEAVQKETDIYLSNFAQLERELADEEPAWLRRVRKAAILRYFELGFPTRKQEEWKYTEVRPIARIPFKPAQYELDGLTADKLNQLTFGNLQCPRLVFVNGHYSAELSSLEGLPDPVEVHSLAQVLKEDPDSIEPYLTRYADYENHPFIALNTAFIQDGAFVYIPKGQVLKEPIHLLYFSTAPEEAAVAYPRNLIVLEGNNQAVILESYVGLGERKYFTNLVTEIVAGENAIADHYKLQQESREAFHIATLQVHQDRSSSVRTFNVTLGGALTRNEVNVVLDGEGADCALDGLYLISGRQHVDNHTRLEHAKPHCDSREIYKGILDEKATAVFHGRIVVQPGAQKTDSKQTNNNLLLSDEALINTKPQLEIYANDVKCTHGATIGQLDQDALFYLCSRGIDKATARSLLIYAFASEVVNRIKVESVRVELDKYLFSWLPKGHLVKEAV
ncbi:Fe-S cluster assembly protein SufD [Acidobacteria bacterium AH-259-G07]|nr:Fe-S cluster assembly protein SufD [Acidobacteria bacterium AH-259-G07]